WLVLGISGSIPLDGGRPLRSVDARSSGMSDRTALLSDFSYALGAGDAGGAGWSVWGRIDTGEFSGTSDDIEFDGSQSSTWLGFDRRSEGGILSGVAYSSSSNDSDYTLGRYGASIETDMSIVMPYMEIQGSNGGGGHVMLGVVEGDATLNQTDKQQGTAGLSMYLLSAGGSWPAAELGNSTLSWSGDLDFSTLQTSDSTLTALEASVSSMQFRGGMELAHSGLGSVWKVMPRVGLLLRHDAGDGVTGTGIEFTAGMQMRSGSERFSIDLNLRTLTMHSAEDLSDWGAGIQMRLSSGSGGEGFAFAVGPTWGATEDDLLDRRDAFRLNEADRQRRRTQRLDRGLAGNIGYGLFAFGGLLTPYSEYRFTSGSNGGARQVAGVRFSDDNTLELRLFSERHITHRGEARSKLAVELQKRY
nr:autotransporter domain-containing protein [Gammaproteobacteria bacterium AqS3]